MIDNITAKRLAENMKKLYGKKIYLKDDINGFTPPSNLVTDISYPKVSLGILLSEYNDIGEYDDPLILYERNKSIEDIIKYRSSLINAVKITDVNFAKRNSKLYDNILEASLSIRNINIEAKINKIKESKFHSKIFSYYGFSGFLKDIKINENAKIPDKIYYINDMKAEEGVYYLYKNNLSDYYLTRLFSLGFFGKNIDKKLVPSKWAITAVHNIIEKNIDKDLMDYKLKEVYNYYLFNYNLYGNDLYGLLKPGDGKVELIEILMPGSAYNKYYNYPIIGLDNESGGYYAVRLSFKEYIKKSGLMGDLIIFRFITRDYKLPLGVWVLREASKKMFNNLLNTFNDFNELKEYLYNLFWNKYNISLFKIVRYSKIMNQKSILRYFNVK